MVSKKIVSEIADLNIRGASSPCTSRQTVSRRLLEFNLESHPETEKQLLTPQHRTARFDWCVERKNWPFEKWSQVIFSDESNFQLINRKNTPLVRRFKEEKYDSRFIKQRVQAGGGSIGIWGCMSMKGTGCRKVYSGRMEKNLYIDTLDNELIPSVELLVDSDKPWLFQQDNAPCHKSKKVMAYFNESDIRVMPWPAIVYNEISM